jgi:bacterioferritin-associated ferredoxin
MIVCVCKGLSDRDISAAIRNGATGAEAVAAATGAGTDCGCCVEVVEEIAAATAPCHSPPCPGCPKARSSAAA